MSNANAVQALEARAQMFAALAHPVRLMILNLVERKARHGEELAAILQLKPATISHHLGRLAEVGLLKAQKDQYYQVYTLVPDAFSKPLRELVFMPQPDLVPQMEADAYKNKVLKAFFRHGRLIRIPAQHKKWQVVLEHIVEVFEPEKDYSEREVNQVLLDFSDDVAALRRGLVDEGFMQRSQGIYRRIVPD
jgi:hypothetical protein